MSSEVPPSTSEGVVYPESDGKPMADNTLQWDWMVKIVGELRDQFRGREVFVAGDLFWYPVEGDPRTVAAPDALVAFGRPPGYRGSYKQWEEAGVAPQVVFEVLSPANSDAEMRQKARFYARHGVEEFYIIDPYDESFEGYSRTPGGGFRAIPPRRLAGWVSPRLGVRFDTAQGLRLIGPDGRLFQPREERVAEISEELRRTALAFEGERERRIESEAREAAAVEREAAKERQRAAEEQRRLEAERRREEAERQREEAERQREEAERRGSAVAQQNAGLNSRLEAAAARLRALGLNPDDFIPKAG